MDRPIDLERLSAVFTDHPWLAEALSNGAWWGDGDGGVQVVAPLGDPIAVREALAAFADALGCEATDIGVVTPAPEAPGPSSGGGVVSARRVGRR